MNSKIALVVGLAVLLAGCGTSDDGPFDPPPTDVFGITAGGTLVYFHLEDPGTVLEHVPLTGLAPGDALVALTSDGAFALGRQSRLYRLDVNAGTLTEKPGMPFAPLLAGACFGMDQRSGHLTVVSAGGRRQFPQDDLTGSDLVYAATDPNAGRTPDLAGYAWNGEWVVDVASDVLASIDIHSQIPEVVLVTTGPLGVDVNCASGLASLTSYAGLQPQTTWAPADILVMVATASGASTTTIYVVDTTTGAATSFGTIGWNEPIVDVTNGIGA